MHLSLVLFDSIVGLRVCWQPIRAKQQDAETKRLVASSCSIDSIFCFSQCPKAIRVEFLNHIFFKKNIYFVENICKSGILRNRSMSASHSPGYSQSRSSPSKLYFSRNSMADCANVFLFSGSLAISEYFLLPSFHPPMASVTFRSGLECFSAVAFSKPARP